jgi:hypothetical protein
VNDGFGLSNCTDLAIPRQFWKEKQTLWFDDIVVAMRYIGPMTM